MKKELSILLVIHNEEKILEECLNKLNFADEIIIILDNCTDNSKNICLKYTNNIHEGSWDIEGQRRNYGISKCTKEWILEIDADEHINKKLSLEIIDVISQKSANNFYNIKVDNYIGEKLVKFGWGATFGRGGVSCLFMQGHKIWGNQRVHPEIKFIGKEGPALKYTIEHKFVSNISDLFEKFNSWTHLKALDLIDSNQIHKESFFKNIRRVFTRFLKNYYKRKGHREGKIGFLIAMFAGLFPLVSYLRAKIYLSGFK